jgi:hypothetical protein
LELGDIFSSWSIFFSQKNKTISIQQTSLSWMKQIFELVTVTFLIPFSETKQQSIPSLLETHRSKDIFKWFKAKYSKGFLVQALNESTCSNSQWNEGKNS